MIFLRADDMIIMIMILRRVVMMMILPGVTILMIHGSYDGNDDNNDYDYKKVSHVNYIYRASKT